MKSLVVANWKMHPATLKDAHKILEASKKAIDKARATTLVVAPPALFLLDMMRSYKGKKIAFAIQHAHAEASGAFTGEVSLAQAAAAGCSYAIIGHAEQRARGENNADTGAQVVSALKLKMTPVLCVGESTRGAHGEQFEFIKEQLRVGFGALEQSKIAKVIVAYEPVWAIGAAVAMTPRDMHEMAIFIRKSIVELFGDRGRSVSILYGGSIDENNAAAMMRDGDVDGLLVGRVSIEPLRLAQLIKSIEVA